MAQPEMLMKISAVLGAPLRYFSLRTYRSSLVTFGDFFREILAEIWREFCGIFSDPTMKA